MHGRCALAVGLCCLAGQVAQAEPFAPPGLITLLPAPEATGDGQTPVELHLLALDAAGAPISGVEVKARSRSARILGWSELRPGIYQVELIPPAVSWPGVYDLKIRAKTPDKDRVKLEEALAVRPPLSTALSASVNPAELVLGEGTTAALSIQLEGGEGQPLEGADIALRVSAGEVLNLTDMGGGRFTAKYLPPTVDYPHLALITAADRRDPDEVYAHVALRLVAEREERVRAERDATVLVKVGASQFGPVQASGSGRATVPLRLRPGQDQATLISVVDGENTESPLDLRIPSTPRMQFFPAQAGIPADASLRIPVRLLVLSPEGEPDTTASVELQTSQGSISKPRHEADGVYVAELIPPPEPGPGELVIEASMGAEQHDELRIDVVGARPAALELSADPARLGPEDRQLSVSALIVGPDGAGLSDRSLTLYPTGATVERVEQRGEGRYEAQLATTGTGPVELLAVAEAPVPGNPLRRLVLVPQEARVPNDGISGNMLTVIAVDEYGYPVPEVPIQLTVLRGGGSLPGQTVTRSDGTEQLFYTASREADLVVVQASSGDRRTTASFLQVPREVAEIQLPLSGSEEDMDIDTSWQQVIADLRIDREK